MPDPLELRSGGVLTQLTRGAWVEPQKFLCHYFVAIFTVNMIHFFLNKLRNFTAITSTFCYIHILCSRKFFSVFEKRECGIPDALFP